MNRGHKATGNPIGRPKGSLSASKTAPGRTVPCPVCGAVKGRPCSSITTREQQSRSHGARLDAEAKKYFE